MSDRIYTIPAREVVPGMIWNDLPLRHVHDHGDWITLAWGDGEDDAMSVPREYDGETYYVTIRLPGPSPRELLCSCNEWQLGQGADNAGLPASVPCGNWSTMVPPVHHADECPVYRLRLRLWPVGARFDDADDLGMYVLRGPGDRWAALSSRSLHMLEGVMHREPWLRAAFCEPEVQP